ncbi:MAG: pyruvate, phosphate dikinase, partial [Acidobacteriota bacterium]
MKPGLLQWLIAPWRARRDRRSRAALAWIKARYHIFRVLLANNERALETLAEVDRLLVDNESSRLGETVRELCEIVLELIDGLGRLTDGGHAGLYERLAVLEQG